MTQGNYIPWTTRCKIIERFYNDDNFDSRLIAIELGIGYRKIRAILRENLSKEDYENLKKYERPVSYLAIVPDGLKLCHSCKQVLDFSCFNRCRKLDVLVYSKPGSGLDSECRKCSNERSRKKSKLINGRYTTYKGGAKNRGLIFDITIEEFSKFWQNPCYYCNCDISTIGLDRIDNNFGYSVENIVSCCVRCNKAKRDMSHDEYIEHCANVFRNSYSKLNKGNSV